MRIMWVSDWHVDSSLWSDPAAEAPEDIVAYINSLNPDLVIDTGDTRHDVLAENFALYMSYMSALTTPLYVTLGNHDETDGGCYYSPETCIVDFENLINPIHSLAQSSNGYRLIGIAEKYYPGNKGSILADELTYLETQLQIAHTAGDIPLVFGHYSIGELAVGDTELLALFLTYNVGAYFFGHLHTALTSTLIGSTYHVNGDQVLPVTPTDCGMMICDVYDTGIEIDYLRAAAPWDTYYKLFVSCGEMRGSMPEIVITGGSAKRSIPLKTGQTTIYHAGDDANSSKGIAKKYVVNSSGSHSGTTNIDVAHYVAATLSFTSATKTITDSAGQLATVKTGDTIVIKGSASNNGTYTVATGNVAGSIVVNEALVDESAGAYVSIYKRAALTNISILDVGTGLEWIQNTSSGLKIGNASNGGLYWYNPIWTLHPAAADLQIIAPLTLRIIGGAGEINRYHIGDPIVLAGFANPVNNYAGFVITTVAINGADLDITLNTLSNTLISEATGGSRSISLETQDIYCFAAAANTASVGGHTDWRGPNRVELCALIDSEQPSSAPDITAFPSWSTTTVWTTTTYPNTTTSAETVHGSNGQKTTAAKNTAAGYAALVRGGI